MVKPFYSLCIFTWGEDVRVEANVERRVTDGADGLAGIENHLTAFGVCLWLGSQTRERFKHIKKTLEMDRSNLQ